MQLFFDHFRKFPFTHLLIHAGRSYGCHRRNLCALSAACLHFGTLFCRTRRPGCALPALRAAQYGDIRRVPNVLQAQRLRLVALSAYHVFLLQKLSNNRHAFVSTRTSGAVLQCAMRRVCGTRLVLSCIDLAIRARLACERATLPHDSDFDARLAALLL